MRKTFVISVIAGLFIMGGMFNAFAAEELPVEVNISMLAEEMTLAEAKKELMEDAAEAGLSNRDGKKALEVLEKLIEKGIPVTKAYEAVGFAVENGEDAGSLTDEAKIKEMAAKAAGKEIEAEAENNGLTAEEVSVAVETLDGLVEKGVPVEKARDVVKEAISEDRDPEKLKEMLTSEYAEQAKKEYEKEKADRQAAGETFRDRVRSFIGGVIDGVGGFLSP